MNQRNIKSKALKPSIISALTFSYIYPFISKARKQKINDVRKDLYEPVSNDFYPKPLTMRLKSFFKFEPQYQGSLFLALFQFIIPYFAVCLSTDIIAMFFDTRISTFSNQFEIEYMSQMPGSKVQLAYMVLTNFFANLLPPLIFGFSYLKLFELSIKTRMAVIGAVIEKSFKMNPGALLVNFVRPGTLFNIISVDSQTIQVSSIYCTELLAIPIRFYMAIDSIIQSMPSSGFGSLQYGILVILGYVIVQTLLGISLTKLSGYISKYSDLRIRLTRELVQNVKSIKQLSIEKVMIDRIVLVRKKELSYIRSYLLVETITKILTANVLQVSVAATVFGFLSKGEACGSDTLGIIYNCLQLLLDRVFVYIPEMLSTFPSLIPALKRTSKFLNDSQAIDSSIRQLESSVTLHLKNASFKVSNKKQTKMSSELAKLFDVAIEDSEISETNDLSTSPLTLEVSKILDGPTIVLLTGPNGSGKSTILEGIAGYSKLVSGSMNITLNPGKEMAYAPQNSWVVNASIKDNIIMGRPFDPVCYQQCIEQCNLKFDIDSFPEGDNKICGPRGSLLSGGQRQRVALARLAYGRPQMAILDDPVSALDNRVVRNIIQNLILSPKGLLYGALIFVGAPNSRIFGPFATRVIRLSTTKSISSVQSNDFPKSSVPSDQIMTLQSNEFEKAPKSDIPLERQDYSMMTMIFKYVALCGGTMVVILIISLIVAEQFAVRECSTTLREQILIGDTSNIATRKYAFWIAAIAGIKLSYSLIYAIAHTISIKRINERAISRTLRSQMSTIQKMPAGTLMSVLSRDQRIVDLELAAYFIMLTAFVSIFITAILECAFNAAELLPIVVAMFAISGILQYIYTEAWRQARELMSRQNGRIMEFFEESMEGIPVMGCGAESSGAMKNLLMDKLFEELQDFGVAKHYLVVVRRWMTLRYEMIKMISRLALDLFCIYTNVSPSTRQTCIRYILDSASNYELFAKRFAEFDSSLISLSLISELEDLPEEDYREREGDKKFVVNESSVEMQNIEMSYGSSKVLNKINLKIRRGEKVAIVGRSGAGKSSLLSALYDMYSLDGSCKIIVNGVQSDSMSLSQYRSQMQIVPQEPTIFYASIRFNLDPSSRSSGSDYLMWESLKSVDLDEIVSKLPFKLDTLIDDAQLSDGQMQLICLARALYALKCQGKGSSGILCLDEATSNTDEETCAKLLETVLSMKDTIVIAVMHNLKGIENYDRIIVLDQGRIIEDGKYDDLVQNFDGIFRSLIVE